MPHADLEQALYLASQRFTDKPEWLVLATSYGTYLAHVAEPALNVELERIVALAAAAAGHHERRASEYQLGRLLYGVTFAEQGFVIATFVTEEWVLSLKFGTASAAVLARSLEILPHACRPLLDVWDSDHAGG
jgi:hypothetical protein